MQPLHWQPPVELSEQEEQIVKRIRRAKLFVFLRHHRHELLDETFQQEHALKKVIQVVADRASAGVGRSGERGRSRTGVWHQPESSVGS